MSVIATGDCYSVMRGGGRYLQKCAWPWHAAPRTSAAAGVDPQRPQRAPTWRTCVAAGHKEAHRCPLLIKSGRLHQVQFRQHCAAGLAGRHSRHHVELDRR